MFDWEVPYGVMMTTAGSGRTYMSCYTMYGQKTFPPLDTTGEWSLTASSDGRKVTRSFSFSCRDPDNSFRRFDGALGAWGQRVVVRAGWTNGRDSVDIPMGTYVISNPGTRDVKHAVYLEPIHAGLSSATGQWSVGLDSAPPRPSAPVFASPLDRYQDVTADDLLTLLDKDRLDQLTGPGAQTSLRAACTRIIGDKFGVRTGSSVADWGFMTVEADVVYDTNPLTTICNLLEMEGLVADTDRNGLFYPRQLRRHDHPELADWEIHPNHYQRLLVDEDTSNVYNIVQTMALDLYNNPQYATVRELFGPVGVNSPFGARTYYVDNSYSATEYFGNIIGALSTLAQRELQKIIENRAVLVTAEGCAPLYQIDPLDIVRIIGADGTMYWGPVQSVTHTNMGSTVTIGVPWGVFFAEDYYGIV